MSRTGSGGAQDWPDFLTGQDEEDMTIEKVHDYARAFLLAQGLPLGQYMIDAKTERDGRFAVNIQPRPVLPSFSAQWDNNWRR